MTMLFVKINGLIYTGAQHKVLADLQMVVWTVQHFVNRFEGTVLRLIVDDKISAAYPRFRAPLLHMAEIASSKPPSSHNTQHMEVATELARFTPSAVIQRLQQAPLLYEEMSRFPAVVGFVDISGFTKLSMLLHAQQLSSQSTDPRDCTVTPHSYFKLFVFNRGKEAQRRSTRS
ncbi:hypothetical protein T492DRAFT_851126 [Pavlovales sp. CCMP2436]|nr:hypothetical protein T492DRAFT_851126 [Pavlovales sp. CCMP2436]